MLWREKVERRGGRRIKIGGWMEDGGGEEKREEGVGCGCFEYGLGWRAAGAARGRACSSIGRVPVSHREDGKYGRYRDRSPAGPAEDPNSDTDMVQLCADEVRAHAPDRLSHFHRT